jgi:hypothetical protein
MKKLLLTLSLLSMATLTLAHEGFRHYGYRGPCCYNGSWVGPAIIGGVIGYELSRPPVYTVPPPVVYTQPSVIVQQPTVQVPPAGYHWQEMIDPATNQTKIVLVPN